MSDLTLDLLGRAFELLPKQVERIYGMDANPSTVFRLREITIVGAETKGELIPNIHYYIPVLELRCVKPGEVLYAKTDSEWKFLCMLAEYEEKERNGK